MGPAAPAIIKPTAAIDEGTDSNPSDGAALQMMPATNEASHPYSIGERRTTNRRVAIVTLGVPGDMDASTGEEDTITATYGSGLDICCLENYAAVIEILTAYGALMILPRLSTFGTMIEGLPMRATTGHDKYGRKMRDMAAMEEMKKDNLTLARAVSLFRDHTLRGATVCLLLPASTDDETCMPGSLDEVASCTSLETTRSSLLNGAEFDGVLGTLWQAIHHDDIELKPGRGTDGEAITSTQPHREFATDAAPSSDTNIPRKLKVWLRLKLIMHPRQTISAPVAKAELRKPSRQLLDNRPRVDRSIPLRGTVEDRRPKDIDDEQVIGGLRQPHHSNSWVPGTRPAGITMSKALEEYAATTQGIADMEFLFSLIGDDKITHTCEKGCTPV